MQHHQVADFDGDDEIDDNGDDDDIQEFAQHLLLSPRLELEKSALYSSVFILKF
jgi:hypothetical protein